jgi:hypothetical protein
MGCPAYTWTTIIIPGHILRYDYSHLNRADFYNWHIANEKIQYLILKIIKLCQI